MQNNMPEDIPALREAMAQIAHLPPEDQQLILGIIRPIIERDHQLRQQREAQAKAREEDKGQSLP